MDNYLATDHSELANVINHIRKNTDKQEIVVITDNDNFSSAMVKFKDKTKEVDNNCGFTMSEMTFHLPPPKRVIKNSLDNNCCAICMEEFKEKELYRKTKCCNQYFHKKCLDKWFFKKLCYNCPLCRKECI